MWGKVRQGAPNRGAFFFWGKGAFSVVSFLLQGFRLCGGDKGAMETDEVRDRPLDCFASPSKFVDGICYRETRRGRKENRTLCAK